MARQAASSILTFASLFAQLLSSPAVLAGQDAGAQIRRYQDETRQRIAPREPATSPAIPLEPGPAKAAAEASSEKIHVSAFAVEGVTRFTQAEITAVLEPYVGKDLDTSGIHAAADALNAHYRRAGYFASKVFIPPQEVADVVRLDVYEGYLDDAGGIEVINAGQRVDTAVVQGILQAHLGTAKPIHRSDYERALLIAEDLPGVTTSSTLYPGQLIGTARLRTTMRDLPLFAGNVDVDNFGSKVTGQYRLGTTLYLNSPGRAGDQAVGRLVTSGHGSTYGYLTYLRPVSPLGTRIGASVDYFGYEAGRLHDLGDADGHASDARLYLTHPIVRSRQSNLGLRADVSRLAIEDRNEREINARRHVDSVTIALHGDDDHHWLGPGLSILDASVTAGSVKVRGNRVYRNLDATTARTDGGFSRVNLSVSRLQGLASRWWLYARAAGQWASGNLDSSQKFYVGGAISVPGYPLGEVGGDEGHEIFAELRHDFAVPWAGTLTGGVFFDQAWVKQHESPWRGWQAGNGRLHNSVTLKSAGLSLVQTLPGAWVLRGLIGWQVGDNPVREPATGEASDGSKRRYRAWFQVIRYF